MASQVSHDFVSAASTTIVWVWEQMRSTGSIEGMRMKSVERNQPQAVWWGRKRNNRQAQRSVKREEQERTIEMKQTERCFHYKLMIVWLKLLSVHAGFQSGSQSLSGGSKQFLRGTQWVELNNITLAIKGRSYNINLCECIKLLSILPQLMSVNGIEWHNHDPIG